MPHNLETLSNGELLAAYGDLITLLKRRQVIRTKNIVGDIGEFLVIAHYNTTPGLARLTHAPPNTRNFDATDENGNRYSIKSTTSNRSGTFHFDEQLQFNRDEHSHFDLALIVILSDEYRLKLVKSFTWQQFLENKTWSKTQRAWFLSLTKRVLAAGKQVYPPE